MLCCQQTISSSLASERIELGTHTCTCTYELLTESVILPYWQSTNVLSGIGTYYEYVFYSRTPLSQTH